MKSLKAILDGVMDGILPRRCVLCQRQSDWGICDLCHRLLPWIECACEVCGSPMRQSGICGACVANSRVYHHSIIPFHYRPPVSDLVQGLKYAGHLEYAPALAQMLTISVLRSGVPTPQIILPMPLHNRRMAVRGFNQCTQIAKTVGQTLQVPLDTRSFQRCKNTPAQTDMDEKQRRKNMVGAFRFFGDPGYSHVALLDDVVTSGSTIGAACRTLKSAGISRIQIWAIAKT